MLLFMFGKNFLGGELPQTLSSLTSLYVFDVSENQFEGNLPLWIGNFSVSHSNSKTKEKIQN